MSGEYTDKSLVYAEDLEFVKWVRSGFQYNKEYWQERRSDSEESEYIDKAIEFVKELEFKVEPPSSDRKQILFDRISSSIEEEVKPVPKTRRINYLVPLSIAASLTLLIVFFWPSADLGSFSTDFAENKNIALPDNSHITINAESSIAYDSKTYSSERIIELEGEAFFEVEKGERFVVQTSQGNVEVLGTSFNVYSRDGKFEVICETGKVKVSSSVSDESVILNPGESSRLVDGKLLYEKDRMSASWRNGTFSFTDNSLERVSEEIERQYNVDIQLDKELSEIRYSGFFELGDLNKALESVLWPLGLEYTVVSDKKIEVRKK